MKRFKKYYKLIEKEDEEGQEKKTYMVLSLKKKNEKHIEEKLIVTFKFFFSLFIFYILSS